MKIMKNIHVKSFINDFIRSLYSLSDDIDITFVNDIRDDLLLSVDSVTPLVLILNELIINIFKYAFDENHTGPKEIHTSFRVEKIEDKFYCKCYYKDTGKGIPEGFDISKSNSLGMLVIKELSGQLDGEWEFYNDMVLITV